MGKLLNVGILGAGYMGEVHARVLSGLKGVNVAAICSSKLGSASALISKLALEDAAALDDFMVMLETVKLDALYICLPPYAHCGQFEAAAKRGVHIFIEKPIALELKQASGMVAAARKAGIITQVGYHMRYGAAVAKLKGLIESGRAGKPTLLDARYDCNCLHGPWWREKQKSGGQLCEQVIHTYDLARYFLGEPAAVSGFTANHCHADVPGYTIEDTSVMTLRFKNGTLASISASNCAIPMEWNNTLTVICEKLTTHLLSPDKGDFIFTGGTQVKRLHLDVSSNPYEAENQAFIAAIRAGRRSHPDITDGYRGLEMVSGALLSASRNGAVVKL